MTNGLFPSQFNPNAFRPYNPNVTTPGTTSTRNLVVQSLNATCVPIPYFQYGVPV
ncbi:hypothetical protein CaCOL14_003007 [Colletotrichum acutatum]